MTHCTSLMIVYTSHGTAKMARVTPTLVGIHVRRYAKSATFHSSSHASSAAGTAAGKAQRQRVSANPPVSR